MPIRQVSQVAWVNERGAELIKLKDDGTAAIVVCYADPEKLDDLAEACTAASQALRLIAETKAEQV